MIPTAATAGLDVLNCGLGDLKLKFDPANPIETDRAARAVTDMLKRGYVIFAEDDDGKLHRVTGFDATRCEYVISDVPAAPSHQRRTDDESQAKDNRADDSGTVTPSEGGSTESTGGGETGGNGGVAAAPDKPAKRGRGRPRKLSASGRPATAIAPRAGG